MTDALIWELGKQQARQALYWVREEYGVANNMALASGDGDAAVTVTAWLIWDQIRDASQPLMAVVDPDRPAPQRLPEMATAHELSILDPLRSIDAQSPQWQRHQYQVVLLANQWLARANSDGDADAGTILATVTVAEPVHLRDGHGGVVAVQCPICQRSEGLQWLWDGLCARVACPCGQAEWTPHHGGDTPIEATEWEHITGTAIPLPPDYSPPPEGEPREPSLGNVAGLRNFLTQNLGAMGEPMFDAQLRSRYYSHLLVVATYDQDPQRVGTLLSEASDHVKDHPELGLAYAVGSKLKKLNNEFMTLYQKSRVLPDVTRRTSTTTALVEAASPPHLREEALRLCQHLGLSLPSGVLQPRPPRDLHRVHVELMVLAAHATSWVTFTELYPIPWGLLYDMAVQARLSAREIGMLPASAVCAVSEHDARRLLKKHFGHTPIAAIPPWDQCSAPEKGMISLARRHLLDGTPPEERLKPMITAMIDTELAAIDAQRDQERRKRAEQHATSKQQSRERRQQRKRQSRHDRKKK